MKDVKDQTTLYVQSYGQLQFYTLHTFILATRITHVTKKLQKLLLSKYGLHQRGSIPGHPPLQSSAEFKTECSYYLYFPLILFRATLVQRAQEGLNVTTSLYL